MPEGTRPAAAPIPPFIPPAPPASGRAAPSTGGAKGGSPSPLRPTVSNTTPVAPPPTRTADLPAFPERPSAAAPTPHAPPPAARPPSTTGSGTPTPARRAPINPFLANDPNQKAKRLARALVSDMVAYQPQKRDEAMRNGTLKQIFREEIKKSYEEYLDQVGKEFAEGTTHFQDALNEILAGGQKMF
jgi:hypothetical protein